MLDFTGIKYFFTRKDSLPHRIKTIIGFYPKNISLYKQSFIHKSISEKDAQGFSVDNERLEYLGDSVIDIILADYLFKKFPYEDEGFLTQLRSKVVNRKQLSELACNMGLDKLVQVNGKRRTVYSHIYGNAFEALVGAIYLDRGFAKAKKFIINEVLGNYIDIFQLKDTETNPKSKLLEWVQKNNSNIHYHTIVNPDKEKSFLSRVILNDKEYEKAIGHTKKEAEQNASFIVLKALKISF